LLMLSANTTSSQWSCNIKCSKHGENHNLPQFYGKTTKVITRMIINLMAVTNQHQILHSSLSVLLL
jgi:hypothetical protein